MATSLSQGRAGAPLSDHAPRVAWSERLDALMGSNRLPLLLALPILALVVGLSLFIFYMTFVPGLPTEGGFTLSNWARLRDPYLYSRVLPNTLVVGVATVLIAVFFAAPLAWILTRTTTPFRRPFMAFIALIAVFPGFIKGMGWLLLFQGRIGIGNRFLMDTFGFQTPPFDISNSVFGTAWVLGLTLAPTMFFLLAGPMQALDPAMEEAASTAGANRWRSILTISLPLVWPATLGGIIYTFMTAISIFEIPALLNGTGGQVPVLATELYYAVNPPTGAQIQYGSAGVYGALIALPSLVALYFYLRVISQSRRFETITGRGYRPRPVNLGRGTWLAFGFVVTYLLLAAGLPLLLLIWTSLLPGLRFPSMEALRLVSLENYLELGDALGGARVVWNTISLVAWSAGLTVIFSFVCSWVVVRARTRFAGLVDALVMLPHAIPGLAFAFALVMVGIVASLWVPWLPLKGTIAILVIANLVNRIPFGTRITNAALLQISPELEEAARLSGAGTFATIRGIVIRLLQPALLYLCLYSALLTFREVSMALMLQEADNVVLSNRIWVLWRQGNLVEAAAAGVVMVLVLGGLGLLTELFLRGRAARQQEAEV